MLVLAGDIGGTNLRLALARSEGGRAAFVAQGIVRVADQPDLGSAVNAFLAAHPGARPGVACLGVAGTVSDGGARVKGVNLPWEIEARALERASGIPRVVLVNDFHAAARGVEQLREGDWVELNPGTPREGAPIAVLGAGTGLGEAFLVPGPRGRIVLPTEGGHRDFSPKSPLQDRLLAALREKHRGRVSTERVLSGPGLLSIYEFLRDREGMADDPEVLAAWGTPAAGQAISTRGLRRAHPTSAAALDLFVDVYGSEAGDVVLTLLALGGVYLAGGIAPDVLVEEEPVRRFNRAYRDKGRLSPLVAATPVRLVVHPQLGLLGAAGEALSIAPVV